MSEEKPEPQAPRTMNLSIALGQNRGTLEIGDKRYNVIPGRMREWAPFETASTNEEWCEALVSVLNARAKTKKDEVTKDWLLDNLTGRDVLRIANFLGDPDRFEQLEREAREGK